MRQESDIRIGVLVPTGNSVHEREFAGLATQGVNFRFEDFSYPPAGSAEFCGAFVSRLSQPIAALAEWGANLVLVGCTTASMTCASPEFTAELEAIAGIPVITAADAGREAVAALNVRSVSVATPYGALNNTIIAGFLASLEVDVAAIAGMDLDRSVPVWLAGQAGLTTERVLEFSMAVDVETAQALYLPCTGMCSLEVIDRFERRTGKVAFSSVQSGYWASLRRLGIDGRRPGNGRLLEIWDF